jgi:hypothetical protein
MLLYNVGTNAHFSHCQTPAPRFCQAFRAVHRINFRRSALVAGSRRCSIAKNRPSSLV